jgi:hypothetical protein
MRLRPRLEEQELDRERSSEKRPAVGIARGERNLIAPGLDLRVCVDHHGAVVDDVGLLRSARLRLADDCKGDCHHAGFDGCEYHSGASL